MPEGEDWGVLAAHCSGPSLHLHHTSSPRLVNMDQKTNCNAVRSGATRAQAHISYTVIDICGSV